MGLTDLAIKALEAAVRQLRARRGERATTEQESQKRQIELLFDRAAQLSATRSAIMSTKAIGQAVGLSASELQPLLDELVQEGHLFRDHLLPAGHYSRQPTPWSSGGARRLLG